MKQIRNLSIVVVEDNVFYQQLIAKQLEPISPIIHFFTSGEQCLENLINCKADLIVLDNNLGGELSGLQTLKQIRIADENTHVIIFSTEKELHTPENLLIYGVFEYVEKNSYGFKKLKETIVKSETYVNMSKL
jgi:CheY-like chemotaxis protein